MNVSEAIAKSSISPTGLDLEIITPMAMEEETVVLDDVRTLFEHDSLQGARDAAMDDAASTGGRVFPCTVFRQGNRTMIATAFPFAFVSKHVRIDSAVKGGSPRESLNRPLMTDHVKTIKAYLHANRENYIMPPVSLNVRKSPQIHVAKTNAAMRIGYIVIDDSTVFHVTDGQHRIAAIAGTSVVKPPLAGVLDEDSSFRDHALTVQLIVEPSTVKIHQDFADAAQTKPIPPSLLAAYNQREPLNRVLAAIVEESDLFRGRIDETSKTLPKASQAMFLLNQIRGLAKELLMGDYAVSDEQLAAYTAKRLGSPDHLNAFVVELKELLDLLALEMDPWKHILTLPVASSVSNQIPDLRNHYLNMTATGLVLIGHTAFEINKLGLPADNRLELFKTLAHLDWRRDAPMWSGSVITVSPKGKQVVTTSRAPVKIAENKILIALGLREAPESPPTEIVQVQEPAA